MEMGGGDKLQQGQQWPGVSSLFSLSDHKSLHLLSLDCRVPRQPGLQRTPVVVVVAVCLFCLSVCLSV